MRIVLYDKKLNMDKLPADVEVREVSYKELDKYANNPDVVAIAGSRAMAIRCADINFPSLKLFQLTSAGFDGVPCERFAKKGIAVANAGNVYSAPIAETVVFGILSAAKKLRPNINNRHFKLMRGYNLITELQDKRVLIMGAGNIGTAVANRLSGFDMIIDGYDPYCAEKTQYNRILRNTEELYSAAGEYDYIVSTMPDNEQTRRFVGAELISKLKQSAVIVNVGRRAVFDEDALYRALKAKKIGGAVLDMFEKLPNPITNKFRRLKNVMVLPGVAAISREVNERLSEHMTNNIVASLCGEEISNVINGVR